MGTGVDCQVHMTMHRSACTYIKEKHSEVNTFGGKQDDIKNSEKIQLIKASSCKMEAQLHTGAARFLGQDKSSGESGPSSKKERA